MTVRELTVQCEAQYIRESRKTGKEYKTWNFLGWMSLPDLNRWENWKIKGNYLIVEEYGNLYRYYIGSESIVGLAEYLEEKRAERSEKEKAAAVKKWQVLPLDENGELDFHDFLIEFQQNNPIRFSKYYSSGGHFKHGFAFRQWQEKKDAIGDMMKFYKYQNGKPLEVVNIPYI